ncbi:unnamed protein product [Urochloa humidicola]
MAGPNRVLPKSKPSEQASGSQDKSPWYQHGTTFRNSGGARQGPVVVGAKHQSHKRDRAISIAGRVGWMQERRWARVANRGRLASRKLTAGAGHCSARALLPPLAATRSCTCLCLPGSGLRVRLGPWRRREATPVGAGRP